MVDWAPVDPVATPSPVIPDYQGPNIRGIVPALLGPGDWRTELPAWMPDEVRHARQAVLLVLDGLGWDQLQDHRHLMPTVSSLNGGPITSVAPTTTATALSSIATGLTPGEHGLIGYRMVLGGDILNVLRWCIGENDVRRMHPPADVQPFPAFLGLAVPVVSPAELQTSGFSVAHLRGSKPVGWRAASSIAVEVGHQLTAGERFVYAYYGGIDKIAHERGFGEYYEAELRAADRIVGDMIETLPAGAALLVIADHGQVHVGPNIVHLSKELLAHVALQSGEGRFRWLHARRGGIPDLLAATTAECSSLAWVVAREQMLDEHWFGPTIAAPIASRLGDVAIVAHQPVSYWEPADSGPFELVCRHGSLTSAEVRVPLVAALG